MEPLAGETCLREGTGVPADVAAELEGYPGSGGEVVPLADLPTRSDVAPSSGRAAGDIL